MALFAIVVLWLHLRLLGLPRFAAGLLQANEVSANAMRFRLS
jgi:hypothetical protein